jgi:hypothetical protein
MSPLAVRVYALWKHDYSISYNINDWFTAISSRTDLYELFGTESDRGSQYEKLRQAVKTTLQKQHLSHDDPTGLLMASTLEFLRLGFLLLSPTAAQSKSINRKKENVWDRQTFLLDRAKSHAGDIFVTGTTIRILWRRAQLLYTCERLWTEQRSQCPQKKQQYSWEIYRRTVFARWASYHPLDLLTLVLTTPNSNPGYESAHCSLARLLLLRCQDELGTFSPSIKPSPRLTMWTLLVFDSFANGYYEQWLTELVPKDEWQKETTRIFLAGWTTHSADILSVLPIKELAKLVIQYLHPTTPYF